MVTAWVKDTVANQIGMPMYPAVFGSKDENKKRWSDRAGNRSTHHDVLRAGKANSPVFWEEQR